MTLKCTTEIKWEKWFETVSVSLWRVWRNCFDPDRRYKHLTLQLSELAPSVRFLQKWCESLPLRWKVRTSKGQDPKCVMDSRRWDFRSPQRQPSYWHSRQRVSSTVQANPFPSEITSSFLNILSPVPENIYWWMCLSYTFLSAVIKYSEKSNLKEKGLIFSSESQVTEPIVGGKS